MMMALKVDLALLLALGFQDRADLVCEIDNDMLRIRLAGEQVVYLGICDTEELYEKLFAAAPDSALALAMRNAFLRWSGKARRDRLRRIARSICSGDAQAAKALLLAKEIAE